MNKNSKPNKDLKDNTMSQIQNTSLYFVSSSTVFAEPRDGKYFLLSLPMMLVCAATAAAAVISVPAGEKFNQHGSKEYMRSFLPCLCVVVWLFISWIHIIPHILVGNMHILIWAVPVWSVAFVLATIIVWRDVSQVFLFDAAPEVQEEDQEKDQEQEHEKEQEQSLHANDQKKGEEQNLHSRDEQIFEADNKTVNKETAFFHAGLKFGLLGCLFGYVKLVHYVVTGNAKFLTLVLPLWILACTVVIKISWDEIGKMSCTEENEHNEGGAENRTSHPRDVGTDAGGLFADTGEIQRHQEVNTMTTACKKKDPCIHYGELGSWEIADTSCISNDKEDVATNNLDLKSSFAKGLSTPPLQDESSIVTTASFASSAFERLDCISEDVGFRNKDGDEYELVLPQASGSDVSSESCEKSNGTNRSTKTSTNTSTNTSINTSTGGRSLDGSYVYITPENARKTPKIDNTSMEDMSRSKQNLSSLSAESTENNHEAALEKKHNNKGNIASDLGSCVCSTHSSPPLSCGSDWSFFENDENGLDDDYDFVRD